VSFGQAFRQLKGIIEGVFNGQRTLFDPLLRSCYLRLMR